MCVRENRNDGGLVLESNAASSTFTVSQNQQRDILFCVVA